MHALIRASLAAVVIAGAPVIATAQTWTVHAYDDAGFAVQTPAAPTLSTGDFRLAGRPAVPSKTYRLTEADVVYSVTVADFRATPVDETAVQAEVVKSLAAEGAVLVDVEGRIDRQFGRQLSVARGDAGRSVISVFFVNHRLYVLEGRALPPDVAAAAGKATRFQQSLEFIGLGAEAFRPENRPLGGAGGPGPPQGGRRRPPPQAFEDCQGKALGQAVQHRTLGGLLAATCIQTPDGLAARPDQPLRGGSPEG